MNIKNKLLTTKVIVPAGLAVSKVSEVTVVNNRGRGRPYSGKGTKNLNPIWRASKGPTTLFTYRFTLQRQEYISGKQAPELLGKFRIIWQ